MSVITRVITRVIGSIAGHFVRVTGLSPMAKQAKAAKDHFSDLSEAGKRTIAESRATLRRYKGIPDPAIEDAREAYRRWKEGYKGSISAARAGLMMYAYTALTVFAYCVYLGATMPFALNTLNISGLLGWASLANVLLPIPTATLAFVYASYKLYVIRHEVCLSFRQWFDAISEYPSELIPR